MELHTRYVLTISTLGKILHSDYLIMEVIIEYDVDPYVKPYYTHRCPKKRRNYKNCLMENINII